MNVLGYLVTLANIQNFAGSGGPLQDLSVRVGQRGVLADELKRDPQFNPEFFRDTSFYRVGNVGKYLSKSLQDYLFNGDSDPNGEGLIITLNFTESRKFVNREGTDGALTMFLPRGKVSEEDRQTIEKYAKQEHLYGRRPRSVSQY